MSESAITREEFEALKKRCDELQYYYNDMIKFLENQLLVRCAGIEDAIGWVRCIKCNAHLRRQQYPFNATVIDMCQTCRRAMEDSDDDM